MTTDLAIQTNLPALAKSVTAARNTEIINRMAPDEVVQFVDSLCLNIISRIGQQNIGADIIRATKVDIQDALKGKYKAWNSGEIMLAVNMGARGELGVRESHFCSRTVFQWLNAYDETVRRKANQQIEESRMIEAPGDNQPTTPEEMLKHLEVFYQSWLALKEGEVLGNYIGNFRFAWRLNLLRFSDVAMWRYANKAIETLGAEYAVQKQSRYRHERLKGVSGGHLLENIDRAKSIEALPEAVKTEAGRLALIEWFEHLKEMESSPSKQMQDLPQ